METEAGKADASETADYTTAMGHKGYGWYPDPMSPGSGRTRFWGKWCWTRATSFGGGPEMPDQSAYIAR